MTISNDSRARIKKVFEPIALGMGRIGLTPDALTLIGFGITVVGAVLVAMQQWLVGGVVIFLGGAFDMFDGTLARATGKVSKLGAFMDSVFDRAGESIVYLGIVVGAMDGRFAILAILAAAAMGAAFMVSYARAKSEGLGFTSGTGMAAVGIMPREVRLVILSLGLVIAGYLGVYHVGPAFPADDTGTTSNGGAALALALGIITIGSIITVIQRILHVRRQAKSQSTHPAQ
jgi:CDP-diacylglycerol---glycerol-3-phosphate 3-phosphatidyltransferase